MFKKIRRLGHFSVLFAALFFAFPVQAEAPQVVATIKPVHSWVAAVMQGVGSPTLLLKGSESPHHAALKPTQMKALQNAKVVVWVGPNLETFLEKAVNALPKGVGVVTLGEQKGLTLLPAREGGNWDSHDHGHGGDHDSHGHDEHGHEKHSDHKKHEDHGHEAHHDDHGHHDHGGHKDHHGHEDHHDAHGHHEEAHEEHGADAHFWLDPHNAKLLVNVIADQLSEMDPAHASSYRKNASEVSERLDALDKELKQQLVPIKNIPYIVFHDAYQYFEKRYGVEAVGSITVSPEQPVSAKRLKIMREKIATLNARCVFTEPQFPPQLARIVLEGTSAQSGALDPLGAALKPGSELYFTLMRSLGDNLVKCLKG